MQPTRAIGVLFAGSLLCLAGAFHADLAWAQQQGAPDEPASADRSEGPRFIVKAINFEALDETGLDFLGSDEVVFTFRTPNYLLVTGEYVNIDSDGEVYRFKPGETCIAPAIDAGKTDGVWQCSDEGVPGPITFTVGAYEQDQSLWNMLRNVLWAVLDLFGYGSLMEPEVEADIRGPQDSPGPEDAPNQLIGADKVQYSVDELLEKMPEVGRSYRWKTVLVGECNKADMATPCTSNEPVYEVTYEITRVR